MASQEIIQAYLQRHKVGLLFEDLMSKLINDQPEQPLTYLVGVIQIKAEKKGERSHLRKSTGDLADSGAVAKEPRGGYVKPWQTNSKRLKPKETTDTKLMRKSMPSRPEWNAQNKGPTDLDDFWDQGGTTKGGTRGGRQAGSPTRAERKVPGTAWVDNGDEDLLFRSYGYRGPHRGRVETEDALEGEFSLAKADKTKATTAQTCVHGSKRRGQKQDTLRHKQELEQLVLDGQRGRDSGIEEEEDRDLEEDSAMELMEDLEELKREGVTNLKKAKGIRISKSQRPGAGSAQSQVKVSICARCAQVMGAGVTSEPLVSNSYGELPDYEEDTEGPMSSRPQSARFTASPGPFTDEDDFESVSQVTGPRRPVWQESDTEVTPRKGSHMFTSNMSPTKGFPMYSTERPSSSDGRHPVVAKDRRADPLHQTWSPGARASGDYSDTAQTKAETKAETEVTTEIETAASTPKDEEVDRVLRSTSPSGGSGWMVPEEDTDASSIYGAPVKGQKQKGTYQGAF